MQDLKLVCLIAGNKKAGGKFYKATIKGRNADNMPVVGDFFLPEELGEKMVSQNLIEEIPINVLFDFDNYMRPSIVDITRKEGTSVKSSSLGQQKLGDLK